MSDGAKVTYNFNVREREGGRILQTVTVFAGSPKEAIDLAKDCLPSNLPHDAVLEVDDTSKDEK